VGQVLAVDNIMSYGYFRDLLPMLKQRNPGVSLFYEMKANLKRVLSIQPGIESLSSHVLRLMRKGVSALQNVALLRMCREYGIELAWNLLYGFPGETPEDYQETAEVIEALYHLKPPGAVARIRLDRFSPNFDFAEQFGFVNVRPNGIYGHLYGLPPGAIANLAYFFEFDYADGHTPAAYVAPALEKIEAWKANRGGDLVKRYGSEPELTLVDTRPGRRSLHFPLNGLQREIYDFCDEIRSLDALEAFAAQRAGRPVAIGALIAQFLEYKLMLREGGHYLSLAVDPTRARRPAAAAASA
jgi:ribosomal peptide maturation radical SAM protein 1